ncbi:MAG TPA: GAF and ANTAR domain-containing protein [Acidimicrobiales bacterium]|nr:GAF and ANTAR domain-containing protein [Acidimicrobiales bacterium]
MDQKADTLVHPHIEPAALRGALARIRRASPEHSLRPSLELVCHAAVELFGVDGCGLMMLDDEQALRYVVATDEAGRVLEQVQEEVGEGPCVDALVHDVTVATSDVTDDDRWPRAGALLEATQVRAVLGLPIKAGGGAVGSLNVYRSQPYSWDDSEIDALRAFASVGEGLVATALLAVARDEMAEQLQHALDHRVNIERAVGVLMGRHQLDPVGAFNMLRTEARSQRRKAIDVANDILADFSDGR